MIKSEINIQTGKASQEEVEWIFTAELEAHPNDPNRIRFVSVDGTPGQWFSRLWDNVQASQVLPKPVSEEELENFNIELVMVPKHGSL